jgi:hypothetical protein
MKKVIISLLIILISTICAAQKFNGGITAGVANTDVKGTDPYDVDFNKVGITTGIFTALPISEKSGFRMEMNFIQKGSYIPPKLGPDTIANGPDTSLKLRLHYVEIPLLYYQNLHFKIRGKDIDRFGFEIGPSIGFLVSSKVNINQYGFSPISGTPYKKYDLSAAIGIYYRIADNLAFHFRYENSVLPIHKYQSGKMSYYNFHFNIGETNMVFTYSFIYTL